MTVDGVRGAEWTKQRALADVEGYMDYLLDPDVTPLETTCRIVEGGGTPTNYERLYVGRYSRIAHLVSYYQDVYGNRQTACGKCTDRWWRGTGSQDEHDRAASLPTCERCRHDYLTEHRRHT